MKFMIYAQDKPDSLAIRKANREAHLAWLKAPSDVTVNIAGPWLDDDGVMRGSMLVVEAESKQAVKNWISKDPYGAAGLTASVTINAYNWVIGAPS